MSLIEVNQAILAGTVLSKSANLGGIFSLKDLDTIYLFIWFTIVYPEDYCSASIA